jgi:RNA polymerase sigma factor (TIGR02999 family)
VNDITLVLRNLERGDVRAADQLLSLVYEELRRLAAAKMARESGGHTLQPTALVHEAWLRLGGDDQPTWQNRAHFFGAAAEAMRRILIDRARRRAARRHGGGQERVNVDDIELGAPAENDDQLLAINEALEKLAALDPKKAELVKLRYFVGLNHAEAAAMLGIAEPTAKRWWAYARAWLFEELSARGAWPA